MKSLGNEKPARFLLFQLQTATFQMIKQFAIRRYYNVLWCYKNNGCRTFESLEQKLYVSTCLEYICFISHKMWSLYYGPYQMDHMIWSIISYGPYYGMVIYWLDIPRLLNIKKFVKRTFSCSETRRTSKNDIILNR